MVRPDGRIAKTETLLLPAFTANKSWSFSSTTNELFEARGSVSKNSPGPLPSPPVGTPGPAGASEPSAKRRNVRILFPLNWLVAM